MKGICGEKGRRGWERVSGARIGVGCGKGSLNSWKKGAVFIDDG